MSASNYKPVARHKSGSRVDFYPTPPWATKALVFGTNFFDGVTSVWEPARGNGEMSKIISQKVETVVSTDLYEHNYGTTGINFLDFDSPRTFDAIVTNPPFSLADKFLVKAMKMRDQNKNLKIAFLLRLQFLEGKSTVRNFQTISPVCLRLFRKN